MNINQVIQDITNNAQQNEPKIFPRYTKEKIARIPAIDQAGLITFYINLGKNKYDIVRLPLQDDLTTIEINSNWDNISNSSSLDRMSKVFDLAGSGITSLLDGAPVKKGVSLAKDAAMFSLKANNAQSFLSTYSRLYWNGSKWGSFSYDFTLMAIEDTVEDVINPLKKLASWASPTTSKTMFKDDGKGSGLGRQVSKLGYDGLNVNYKNYVGQFEKQVVKTLANDPSAYYLKSPPLISVKIGTLLELNQVALTSVSFTPVNCLDDQGLPVEIKGRISFQPTTPPSSLAVSKLFKV